MSAPRMFASALLTAVLLVVTPVMTQSGEASAQAPLHNCSFCHNLHGGAYASLSDFAVTEDLCLSCHGEAGPAQVDRDGTLVDVPKSGRGDEGSTFVAHNGAKHTLPTSCFDCHNHEHYVEPNLKMIDDQMQTPNDGEKPVVFTAFSGANSYADGDATYDGVCEVCHTITTEHRNDGSVGGHQAGDDCSACHKHGSGFGGAGGGCAGCHSSTQGARRAVVGEFDRTSHHVDWAGGGLANSGEIPDSDCETCHDQSAHQAGNVRLWDVDDPGNTAASIVLTGDPNTSSTEAAKLGPFCLGCHDADGANGNTTPFTGGATVPPIDAAAWAAASHETSVAIAGCYGNGTIGCHSSGHGSQKTKLLGPPGTAATSPAFAEQEEGFCFNCHDSDGPAATDVASQFGTAINWVNEAVGPNPSNMNINDRHDVQYDAQLISGAKLECHNCHDPHAANAGSPLIADPDPTDGRVPGTGQVLAGMDFQTEWCTDCHDGSYPTGVNPPTNALRDVRGSFTTDSHGGATASGGKVRGGTGWTLSSEIPCLACHDWHPRSVDRDFVQVKDTVYAADGTTPLASDNSGFGYSITNFQRNAATSGYDWCDTCHIGAHNDRKTTCFSCHVHGSKW